MLSFNLPPKRFPKRILKKLQLKKKVKIKLTNLTDSKRELRLPDGNIFAPRSTQQEARSALRYRYACSPSAPISGQLPSSKPD